MSKTENIFEKTARLLKENNLTLDILTPDVIEDIQGMTKRHTDNAVTNLTEQVDPEDYGIIDGEKGKEDGAERLYKQHAHDNEDYVDNSPFTKKEALILKQLHKALTPEELEQLTEESPQNYAGGSGSKFWKVLKIFGIPFKNDVEYQTTMSKYAKWAFDNWTEEGDYGSIETPIKIPLKWYDIEREESGTQVEYKSGNTDVLGFDEDDAEVRGDNEFWDWGGEMETHDWGDYETYDSEIASVNFQRVQESRKFIKEQQELDNRTKALISIGGIQRDKVTTPTFIKNIFKSSGHQAKSSGVEPEDGGEWNRFYTPGTNIDLDADVERIRDRIRFEEYGEMFQQGIEGRGFAFEGMLAGLFNGEPMKAGGKEDIKVGDDYYSIKQSNPGDAWDTGSLMEGYGWAKKSMEDDGLAEEEIPPTPLDLMIAGDDYRTYKAEMLIESFKSSNGKPLKWIFAHVLDDKHIKYVSMDSDDLISILLSSDCSDGTRSRKCAVGKSRKKDTGLRIKSQFVLGGDPKMITFPSVSDEDIRSIIYDPKGDRIEDKIRRIFRDPNKVSQYTVEYIRDNPKDFLDAVNREIPNLTTEEKKLAYDLLMEESDVFGQGLLDPIEPEEFEGEEEEWEKLVDDVDDGNDYDYEDDVEIYTGGKTDPERGFVAPSKEVTTNVCRVEGFCQEQGPITFGQLKELVEAATSKRIQADIGRGVFKSLWRIIPFFVPQILLAAVGVTVTRAFNKIITPALTDTKGYKSWWGKAVLKAMDIAEGDYIPDVALGDDPLSKVFFISDGLLSMIKDKYKLKFARYVAEYAATRPDNEPVPEWFVENLLRDYLNQKFLLNPPLPVKIDIETKEQIEESKNPFGLLGDNWKDQILKHEENLTKNELKYKKLADNLDGMNVTIPVDIHDGAEPVIGTTDITFTIVRPYIFQGLRGDFFDNMRPSEDYKDDPKRPTVIKYDLVFRGVEPGSILEELLDENSLEGMHIHNISARERLIELLVEENYNINESLMEDHFKLYGVTIGRLGNIYDSQRLQEQNVRDSWQEERKFTDKDLDDSNLNISPDTLWEYLDSNHREKLIYQITPTLNCVEYNCYDGWKEDVENEWSEEEAEELAHGYCEECGEELNNELEKIDADLGKMGFLPTGVLQKPFPYSYNVWIDGVVKEVNPRFYVDANEDISYEEGEFGVIREPLDETIMDEVPLEQFKTENPEVEEILNRFPEDLQRELAVERKNPQEFVKDFGNYYLNSEEPIEIYLEDELNKDHTHDTMSRTPQDVVDVINDTWDTDFESGEVFDPNPSRYFEYAQLSPHTAPPSLMVNGEILYGVARFVSALVRGDETIKVWDIIEKENLNEHNQRGINPELEVGDIVRVIEVDGEHARMPETFGLYKVIKTRDAKMDTLTSDYYDIVPYPSPHPENYDYNSSSYPHTAWNENVKTLYRGDTWIYGDIPMANKVDRKTISEHKESKLNPKLQIGDEIIVLDVGVEVKNDMNKPDTYIRYFVTKIYTGDKWGTYNQPYYGLNRPDIDVTDPERPGVFDKSSTHKHLYPRADTWMFNPKGPTMRYEDAFQPDHYLSDEEYEELYGDDGQDEYGGYPDLIPETKKEKIREHTDNRLNPALEEGDTILIVDRRPAPPGIREPFPEHEPELFTTYVVTHKVNTGHKATHPYHYFLLPEEEYEIFINDPQNDEVDIHEKSLFPWIHDWILDKEDLITEQKDSKLNPELMVGDEIIVVATEGIHDFGAPNLFKPYVVVGIKHGTTMNREIHNWTHGEEDEEQTPDRNRLGFRKGFDTIPYTYYQIEPIGETDKERLGHMLAGGGRRKPMYIFPSPSEYRGSDQWILRPGFRRGETWVPKPEAFNEHNEHKESKLNPELMIGDEITVLDVDTSFGTLNTAERFKDYVVTSLKQSNQTQEFYYEITPIGTPPINWKDGSPRREHIYADDTWILRKGFLRGEHLTEDDSVNDLVYRDEPRTKHIRRMNKDLGGLEGFPIETFKNMPPPENESDTTEEEINHLESIPVNDKLIHSADEIDKHFKIFLDSKGLEWPERELKKVIRGVRALILQLKYYYNRPRPWQVAQARGLKLDAETLQSASTPSYPSGHATQGRFIGRYLADLYPEYEDELTQIGDDIAFSRNMAKVHYPSDSEFGKVLGDAMYEYVYEEDRDDDIAMHKTMMDAPSSTDLQEQYDMVTPVEAKKRDTTSQLFRILDDNFTIQPHPRGEITYDGQQMALYSYDNETFMPITTLYDSIEGMYEAGLPREDIGIFIDIVTDWVNSRMVIKPELYESIVDVDKADISPDLKVGDRIYVWDITPDPQPPGGVSGALELPTTAVAVVMEVIDDGRDIESFRGGIEYAVKDEMSGEYFGLYGGQEGPTDGYGIPIDRDKWIILPPKPLREGKRMTIQKVRRRTINEALEPDWSIRRGRHHYAMNRSPESGEQITEFNDYLVKKSPFIYDGLEYYLSAIPGNMPGSARIDLFIPQLDKGEDADKIWSKDNLQLNNSHFPRQTQTYYKQYRDRIGEFANEMEEIGKLFSLDSVIINRNINRPWSRTPDSYGNESIRPGDLVPHLTPEIV